MQQLSTKTFASMNSMLFANGPHYLLQTARRKRMKLMNSALKVTRIDYQVTIQQNQCVERK